MTVPTQKDLAQKHLDVKHKVRALETRAFKWFGDWQLGYEDTVWSRFSMNNLQWDNYPYNYNGNDLASIRKHDTIYFRGTFTPSSHALPGAPDVLIGYINSDHRPEVDQEICLQYQPNSTTVPKAFYIAKLEAATGKLLLPAPITMAGEAVGSGLPIGFYDRFQAYNQHWPAVNFA